MTCWPFSRLGFLQIYRNKRSSTAEIIGIYFLGTLIPRKYMPIISAVELFCYNKFEETSNEKVVNMSKLTKLYFNCSYFLKSYNTIYPIYSSTQKFSLKQPSYQLWESKSLLTVRCSVYATFFCTSWDILLLHSGQNHPTIKGHGKLLSASLFDLAKMILLVSLG